MEVAVTVSKVHLSPINSLICFVLFSAMFCNQKCMEEARRRFHDAECSEMNEEFYGAKLLLISDTEAVDITSLDRVLSELLAIAGSVENLRELKHSKGKLTTNLDLSTDLKCVKTLRKLSFKIKGNESAFMTKLGENSLQHKKFEAFLKSKTDEKFLLDYAIRLVCIRHHNGFDFCFDGDLQGGGLLPFGYFFNHSCDPNVGHTFVEGKFVFIVLQPVKKGEQLFIAFDR
jgi:hypothetical protein